MLRRLWAYINALTEATLFATSSDVLLAAEQDQPPETWFLQRLKRISTSTTKDISNPIFLLSFTKGLPSCSLNIRGVILSGHRLCLPWVIQIQVLMGEKIHLRHPTRYAAGH